MRTGVRVGVLLHCDFGSEAPANLARYYRRLVDVVEESGLDGLYIPTEIGWDRLSPLTMLGCLAAWSHRVQIGTCVLLAPMFSPLAVGEAASTAQLVSGGRVVLGLGMGWRREEFMASGVTLRSRRHRLEDHLAALPPLLAGHELNQDGHCHSFAGVRIGTSVGAPPVPLWVGAHSRGGIQRAAQHAASWVAGPFSDAAMLGAQTAAYKKALTRAQRPFTSLVLMRECSVAPTSREAWTEAARIHAKYREYAGRVGAMPFDVTAPLATLAAGRFVIGDPSECAEQLATFVSLTGATDVVLRYQFRGSDPDVALRNLSLLGTEVSPRLNQRVASLDRPARTK